MFEYQPLLLPLLNFSLIRFVAAIGFQKSTKKAHHTFCFNHQKLYANGHSNHRPNHTPLDATK